MGVLYGSVPNYPENETKINRHGREYLRKKTEGQHREAFNTVHFVINYGCQSKPIMDKQNFYL